MTKKIPCILVGNTSSGYLGAPVNYPSISEAIKAAEVWFAWRIFDKNGNLIRRGFGAGC